MGFMQAALRHALSALMRFRSRVHNTRAERPTMEELAEVRGASRASAWCGGSQSPDATSSSTGPVNSVAIGAAAIVH